MDRISALRNIEDALAAFEAGETDLSGLERDVRGVLRTYATDFEGELRAYRASGEGRADGMVVLAADETEARQRIETLLDAGDGGGFEVEPVAETGGGRGNER